MQTPPRGNLIYIWDLNTSLIQRLTAGISQAESLLVQPVQGNCMNWVLGHILSNRDLCLRFLHQPGLLSAAEAVIYNRGSDPLTDAALATQIDELLAKVVESNTRLAAVLEALPDEGFEAEVEFNGKKGVGGVLAFLQWHDTYHVGQLELLRQLAGKTEKVIA